jgi:anti-sigma regulatory factor (Ser/Thr protein kinase)
VSGDVRHGALLYRDDATYLAGALPFVAEGLATGDAVVCNVDAEKAALLRDALGGDADAVAFHDMREVGRNPAHLLPRWVALVEEHAAAGRGVRVLGEPAWPGRRPEELAECDLHEALIDVLAGGRADRRLLCPYDVAALPDDVVATARTYHPTVIDDGAAHPSAVHAADAARVLFRRPLPPPPEAAERIAVDRGRLPTLRRLVAAHAEAGGLGPDRVEDLVLVVTELATNSVRHGGGTGTLRAWTTEDAVVVDLADRGVIDDPLTGRLHPPTHTVGGRGLWISNQLCDLVQVRSPLAGLNVRVHMWRA